MPSNYQVWGTWAEEYVGTYLLRLGWEILARQFRTRFGEIDLIAKDPGGVVVFLEVKARRSHKYGTPEASVTSRKIQKITRCVALYVQKMRLQSVRYRIDVLALDVFPGRPIVLRHFYSVG